MLTLESRPAMLGGSLNTRTEMHGDESVPAHDIPVEGIMLEAKELNALLGSPSAHAALFAYDGGKLPEPAFRNLKSFVLKDKFEDSTVVLVIGMREQEVRLDGCKVSKITLTPLTGGLTQMDCQLQALSSTVDDLPLVVSRLGQDISIALELGEAKADTKAKQADLPINTFGEGEQAEKRASKPATSARRRKRKARNADATLQ